MHRLRSQRVWLVGLVAGLALAAAAVPGTATNAARFTFVKVFPGSAPEYTALTVSEDGEASYDGRALKEQAEPEAFRLPAGIVAQLFRLVAELNYFRNLSLESPRKIASMGEKTFRYQKENERSEVRFNYTENSTAKALLDLCERITRSRYLVAQLQFKLKYDRLGVLSTLREFERYFNSGELIYLEQFVPVLARISNHPQVLRLAQNRAKALLARIQGAPAQIHYERVERQRSRYYAVTLREDGVATYENRPLDQPANTLPLTLSEALGACAFALVRQANYLRDVAGYREPGDTPEGVRLTYEAGYEYNQAAFAHPPTAALAAAVKLFEQILLQVELRTRLTKALAEKSSELVVVLRDLEEAVERAELAEPAEFIPLLEKVVNDLGYYAPEQELARKILDKLRQLR